MKRVLTSLAVAGTLMAIVPSNALAIGGASGPKVDYAVPGKIGEVVVNPYKIAPLTAIIRNGGYELKDIKVSIMPKKDGQKISYTVKDNYAKTYGGIPIFGMYANYYNTIKVEYTRLFGKEVKKIKETYNIFTPPVYSQVTGLKTQKGTMFEKIIIKKPATEKYKDRLYLVNNFQEKSGQGTRAVWNNPMGGALEWNYYPQNFILDTTGEVRWYMEPTSIYDLDSIYSAGVMMGFRQNNDGAMSWVYGQRYVKYDIMGRKIFNRRLPLSYNDASHSMDNSANGHYFIRTASSNTKRLDGKNVRTVRDVIVEVDEKSGQVVDDWELYKILDPYRDINLKVLDQGAVCLNIDASKAGHTASDEELAKMDKNDHFGDIVGSGAGRNWAHVNSVDHDTEDDSIIISSRHQSAVIKIGRDKKVKWILGSPEGWKEKFQKLVLHPIDKNGKEIKCGEQGSKCPGYENEKGGFDWSWTQHTAFKIDSKSKGNILYMTVFDNGDSRGMEQPALPSMKYSRGVIYKIDQKKKTVQQIWEYGKDRGNELYSPVTSITEYYTDKNSIFMYFATAGANFDIATGAFLTSPAPTLMEFDWNAKKPALEMQIIGATGYQAMPFDVQKAFSK